MDGPRKTASLRVPTVDDGAAVHRLISECPPLDENSLYCNLLQCDHFAATTVVAEQDGDVVGCISGYLVPARPDTLFIWQVAVGAAARGQGLALRMLQHLLERPACRAVRFMETSITPDNGASWGLFRKLAESQGAPLADSDWFDRDRHFGGAHDSEQLVRIGPFAAAEERASTLNERNEERNTA
ncbi:MAG TPA: diaminobutyrate acetyltransferase [Halieaceae bacterium]|nr:diaminobutyrate acetyltransferase [Halieaceae bacterium]